MNRQALAAFRHLGRSLGLSEAVLNAACSGTTMSTGGKTKPGLPTDEYGHTQRDVNNTEQCPECGGDMVDGECEDCGYVANAAPATGHYRPATADQRAWKQAKSSNTSLGEQDDDHAPATLLGQRGDGNNQATSGTARQAKQSKTGDATFRTSDDDELADPAYSGGGGIVGNGSLSSVENAHNCPECGDDLEDGECPSCGYIENSSPIFFGSCARDDKGHCTTGGGGGEAGRGDAKHPSTVAAEKASATAWEAKTPEAHKAAKEAHEQAAKDVEKGSWGGNDQGSFHHRAAGEHQAKVDEAGGKKPGFFSRMAKKLEGSTGMAGNSRLERLVRNGAFHPSDNQHQALNQGDPSMWDFTGNDSPPGHLSGADDSQRKAAFAAMSEEGSGGGASSQQKASFAAGKASTEARSKGTASAHRKAGEAHDKAAGMARSAGKDSIAERHDEAKSYHMGQSAGKHGNSRVGNAGRQQLLKALSVNCACQQDHQALNLLSNRALERLAGNADADGSFASASGAGTVQAGGEEDDDDADDTYDGFDDVGASKKGKSPAMSANAYQHVPVGDRLTANERAVLNRAVESEARQKYAMVREIVANIADEDERQVTGNEMMAFDLPKVQRLHRAFSANNPQPTANAFGMSSPLYFGDGVLNRGQPVENADVLDLETARKSYDPQLARNRAEQGVSDTA